MPTGRPTIRPNWGQARKGEPSSSSPRAAFACPPSLPPSLIPRLAVFGIIGEWQEGRGDEGGRGTFARLDAPPPDMYNCAELAPPPLLPPFQVPCPPLITANAPRSPLLILAKLFPFFPCLDPHTFCTTAEGTGKEEKALPPPVPVACPPPFSSTPVIPFLALGIGSFFPLRHRSCRLFLRNAVTERKVLRRKGGDRKRALLLPPTKATRQLRGGGGEERKARRGGMWQQLPVPTE